MDPNQNKWVPKVKAPSASPSPSPLSIFRSNGTRRPSSASVPPSPMLHQSKLNFRIKSESWPEDFTDEGIKTEPDQEHRNVLEESSALGSSGSGSSPTSSGKTDKKVAEWEGKIGGVAVRFPYQPYPAQIAFMDKVLKCLTTNQHGLLESPTGSGKSLSLLCSSLAWQSQQEKLFDDSVIAENGGNRKSTKPSNGKCIPATGACAALDCNKPGESSFSTFDSDMDSDDIEWPDDTKISAKSNFVIGQTLKSLKYPGKTADPEPEMKVEIKEEEPEIQIAQENKIIPDGPPVRHRVVTKTVINATLTGRNFGKQRGARFSDNLTNDEDEKPSTSTAFGTPSMPKIKREVGTSYPACEITINGEQFVLDDESFAEWDDIKKDPVSARGQKKDEVPKIYFGSRTHKQITQLVGELRKTSYGEKLKMTVLGSRDQYCIHPDVKGQKNKDDKCSKLLDTKKKNRNMEEDFDAWGDGCGFKNGLDEIQRLQQGRLGHHFLTKLKISPVFDVEDLSRGGEENHFCPYFASSKLADDSMLIFCPYQYLIDARIRKARKIELEGNIVIFDEGHNMEDAAREAASFSVSSTELNAVCEDLIKVSFNTNMKNNLLYLAGVLKTFADWIQENGETIEGDVQGGSKPYTGPEIIHFLKDLGLGPESGFENTCEVIIEEKVKPESEQRRNGYVIEEERALKISGQTLQLLRGMTVILDYLYRDKEKHATDYRISLQKYIAVSNSYQESSNGFRGKRRKFDEPEWTYKLNFWCMNPGVAFGDFAVAKCVVLTSGTLSPLQSFQSELGLKFGVQFEANHVINMNQVWAGAFGRGPRNAQLHGVYKVTQTLVYQDDLGDAILRICRIVPKGVLCFFSSYSLMNILTARWKESGVWKALLQRKRVFEEPRNTSGDKSIFEKVMLDYYKAVFREKSDDGQDGALMLAVFRGKISEGLDFSDDKARAVITVGIPYPNFMDEQVVMKRKFNDENIQRGFLDQNAWYDIQAFRAINQALGRCLRHRNDWGALILLDQRFAHKDDRYTKSLSKWLRNSIVPHDNFQGGMIGLERFVKARLEIDEKSSAQTGSKSPACGSDILTDDE